MRSAEIHRRICYAASFVANVAKKRGRVERKRFGQSVVRIDIATPLASG